MMTCSSPDDCAEIERRHATGIGLLDRRRRQPRQPAVRRGRRGDPHGQPDRAPRSSANPGYRAFLANGFNVTRALVLFGWEVVLEMLAAARAARRDVRPRGHRGGIYPFLRAAMCVIVRDLIVYGVLTDMMRGPAGRLRDLLELRRGRPPLRARARRHAGGAAQARPAVRPDRARAPLRAAPVRDRRALRPRPDAGRDLQAAQRLRPRRAGRALARAAVGVTGIAGGDEQNAMVGHAVARRPAASADKRAKNDVSDRDVVVLGSGQPRARLPDGGAAPADAGGDRRSAIRELLAGAARPPARRLAARAVGRARRGGARARRRALPRRRTRRGRGSAGAASRRPRRAHLLRTDGFAARRRHHGRQLLRPGARRGLRVRGADLLPRRPRRPADARLHPHPAAPAAAAPSRSIGAAAVHALLSGWRWTLQGEAVSAPARLGAQEPAA